MNEELLKILNKHNLFESLNKLNLGTLIEKIMPVFVTAVKNINESALKGDLELNRKNRKIVASCVDTLRLLEQEVDIECFEEEEFLRIKSLVVNGEEVL